MKSSSFVALGLLASLFVFGSGCVSGGSDAPKLGAIAAEEGAAAVLIGREAGDKLLEAFQKNDFTLVKDLPFGDEKNTLTEERFQQVVEKMIRANGGLRHYVYLADFNRPPYKMLLWKATFTPAAKAAADAPDKAPAAAAEVPETPAAGVDVLFELVMGKLNGQPRVVGFRFKL